MKYDRNHALLSSSIPELPPPVRGKVRDVYDLGDTLLFVATDRLSAFDVIMPNGVPDKGRVLTQLSLFWFNYFSDVPNHLVTADIRDYPTVLKPYAADLDGRSMIVKKLKMVPVECIARGYLVGSGWSEYRKSGTVHGQAVRSGMEQAGKLDTALFCPSVKAEIGAHDENISPEALAGRVGSEMAGNLRELTLKLYTGAERHGAKHGVIIADTKFEFGLGADGSPVLADEVLTPDSSRFWPAADYRTGANPPSLDKQFVRDWLDSIHFNHEPPAPEIPDEIVEKTRLRYLEALRLLSGENAK
ncbi:MAG: phosphoribosylaminoimidazolesuccinocarboxamide synthase [Kiritimatiellae bacterium]|nr:phosphoribosylaminoimidazolesuccinocarboxamide synthase [Kiritimatiellia bacterium]